MNRDRIARASGRRIKLAVEAAHITKDADPAEMVRGAFKVKPEDLTGDVKNGKLMLVRGKL